MHSSNDYPVLYMHKHQLIRLFSGVLGKDSNLAMRLSSQHPVVKTPIFSLACSEKGKAFRKGATQNHWPKSPLFFSGYGSRVAGSQRLLVPAWSAVGNQQVNES